jgi:hypothetical protein
VRVILCKKQEGKSPPREQANHKTTEQSRKVMRAMLEKRKGLLKQIISMRLSPDDSASLDQVAQLIPAIPRLTLARMALRIGLEEIRKRPTRAIAVKR